MQLLILGHELSLEDMKDLGWDDQMIGIGINGDVSYLVALDDDYYEYNITRHLKISSYECIKNTKFRGRVWPLIIVVWN